MKKILLIWIQILFMLTCISSWNNLSAQTYCYQYQYRVNPDTGVKDNPGSSIKYITFTKKMSMCYFSDENGIKQTNMYTPLYASGGDEYQYIGEKNSMYIYRASTSFQTNMGETYAQRYTYLYFSKDFSRMNMWHDNQLKMMSNVSIYGQAAQQGAQMIKRENDKKLLVYQRIEQNKDDQIPSQLW